MLRMKRAFKVKQKAFFIISKELCIAKNCLRPESSQIRRSGAANFAKIVKIANILIKTITSCLSKCNFCLYFPT